MAFGIFTGTFSSIYVAGALLLWIEHRWPRETGETKGTARALAEERRRERSTPAAAGTR
jgi:preprotein translocase subunit SecF